MCYHKQEVISMDHEERDELQEQQEQPRYVPRPRWQVWLARIGLVLFILVIIMYYINMMRGGM